MSGEQDIGDSRPPGAKDLPPIDEEPGYFQRRPPIEQPNGPQPEQQRPTPQPRQMSQRKERSQDQPNNPREAFMRQPTEQASLHSMSRPQQLSRNLKSKLAPRQPSQMTQGTNNSRFHNMAGPQEANSNDIYVHPEYREMNPDYMKNHESPIWGLAKPLPRVVRPGMRRDPIRGDTGAYQTEPKGESEAVPEMKVTPSRHDEPKDGPTTPATPATPSAQKISSRGTYPGSTQTDTPVEQGIMSPDSSDRVSRPVENELVGQWNQPQPDDHEFVNTWALIRHWLREPLAEYLGVSLLFSVLLVFAHFANP